MAGTSVEREDAEGRARGDLAFFSRGMFPQLHTHLSSVIGAKRGGVRSAPATGSTGLDEPSGMRTSWGTTPYGTPRDRKIGGAEVDKQGMPSPSKQRKDR